jgi:hypothetical protein
MKTMSERDDLLVNPNTASLEALIQLPGVGEVLAQRIIESRPYAEADDMVRVPGLGEATLARLSTFLTFEETLEPATETPEEAEEEVEALPRLPRRRLTREKAAYSREATLWLMVGAVVISVALSVLLNLSILAGINQTLNFGRHATVRQLTSDLAEMNVDIDNAISRIETIGRRLEAVEGLSGRVMEMESEFSSLREQVKGSLSQMSSIQNRMVELMQEISFVSERIGVFDMFLEGLRVLLTGGLPTTAP